MRLVSLVSVIMVLAASHLSAIKVVYENKLSKYDDAQVSFKIAEAPLGGAYSVKRGNPDIIDLKVKNLMVNTIWITDNGQHAIVVSCPSFPLDELDKTVVTLTEDAKCEVSKFQ